MMAELEALAHAFHGVTLEYRRSGHDWPARWRCRIVATKNEREDFRITAYGVSAEEAVRQAADTVSQVRQRMAEAAERFRGAP